MITVTLKEARRRLGQLVDAAARGEEVLITRRGRKAARLTPATEGPRPSLPDMAAFRASITVEGAPLSEAVIAEREGARY